MNRRELIRTISILTGAAFVGGDLFLAGCKGSSEQLFDQNDKLFFDEVAETILPGTNTPGAKDAKVGAFIALYASDCYDTAEQQILKKGIKLLNEASQKMYRAAFVKLPAEQKEALLTTIDAEAKGIRGDTPTHYFTLMKQLTLLGFFTSEQGTTAVLRYLPVPGGYQGCIDYNGETAWG